MIDVNSILLVIFIQNGMQKDLVLTSGLADWIDFFGYFDGTFSLIELVETLKPTLFTSNHCIQSTEPSNKFWSCWTANKFFAKCAERQKFIIR